MSSISEIAPVKTTTNTATDALTDSPINTPTDAPPNAPENTHANTAVQEKKTFRSRVSVLLTIFILAAFTPAILSAYRHGSGHPGVYIIGGVILLTALIFTGMRYTISGGKLSFSLWWIRGWSVDIADIRSVRRSYNLLSSPAASLRRLRLDFRKGAKFPFMLISPARERKFIEELKAANPEIAVNVPEKRCSLWRVWDWDI